MAVFNCVDFSYNFFFLSQIFELKESDIAQVIKKYIYLWEAKLNDPLHIISVPNIFKVAKVAVTGTQKSLKRYQRPQKKNVEGDHT